MLRSAGGAKRTTVTNACPLLVFSVGGRRLAVKTHEVAGISMWPGSMTVPSTTPFVSAVIRNDEDVLPVFDLGQLLHVSARGEHPLCLTVKHPRGALVVCIDEAMPELHTVAADAVQPYRGTELDAVGSVVQGVDDVPILSFERLVSVSNHQPSSSRHR